MGVIMIGCKPKKWTAEREAQLEGLWKTSLSAAEIGGEMGVSRCAILGKAHRMNLRSRIDGWERDLAANRIDGEPRPKRVRKRASSGEGRIVVIARHLNISFVKPAPKVFKVPTIRSGCSKTSPTYRNQLGSMRLDTVGQRRDLLAEVMRNTAALPIVEAAQ
jgi:hypothetical protein